jgi:16S rRNA processing protein RimM
MADEELLEVGRVIKPHGVRGEVIVDLVTNRTERLVPGTVLHSDGGRLTVEASRPHQGRWIVQFAGIAGREGAEGLRDARLSAPPLRDPDTFWVHELIGKTVIGTDDLFYGTVVEVEANPASDLLVLGSGGLVPLRFVVERGPNGVVVDVPEGLIEPAPEPVELVPYDPAWPAAFETEAARIREALGDIVLRLDHVGSTSVPELEAKPVIDMQLSVEAIEPASPYRQPLEALGYVFVPDPDAPAYPFFLKRDGARRTHHLHVAAAGSDEERAPLAFRDRLRADPAVRDAYTSLKRDLAARFGDDRVGYANAKSDFVRTNSQ